MDGPRTVPVFRKGAWYDSLDSVALPGGGGWRLSLAPRVLVSSDRRSLEASTRSTAPTPPERQRILRRALHLFDRGTVSIGSLGTQDARQFRHLMASVAGLPEPLTERWIALLRERLASAAAPAPSRALTLVSLPANTFTCLESVFDAVRDSEAVWIRPSRREPVSAARLAAALLEAGWPAERLAFYPTEPDVLPALIGMTDRQVVYGGDGVAQHLRADPALSLRGPGRGCALVPAGADPEAAADWLTPLIAADGGRFCKNVRTVVCEGDPDPLAHTLGARLDAIRIHPADPVWPVAAIPDTAMAPQIAKLVTDRLRRTDRLVTTRPLPSRHGPLAFLAPTLVRLGDPGGPTALHPLVGCELPFPFASVFRAGRDLADAVRRRSLFVYTMPLNGAFE